MYFAQAPIDTMVCLDALFLRLCCLWLVLWSSLANANTEKVIFLAPDGATATNSALESLAVNRSNLNPIGEVSPVGSSAKLLLRVGLPRAFPSKASPRGVDSWVLLKDLKPGARYEVRVCWAATTPSDFWLSVHPSPNYGPDPDLYLKISAIASYYTTDTSLMDNPDPVLVDIILDEFLLGMLPRSLLNVGVFIVIMVGVAWYTGIKVIRWLDDITIKGVKGKAA